MDYKLEDNMQLTMCDLIKGQTNWANITNRSKHSCQSRLYEGEKRQTFTHLNNMITKMAIETDRLKISELSKSQNTTNELKNHMETVHEVIRLLKNLINIENSRLSASSLNKMVKDKYKHNELRTKLNWMKNALYLATTRYNKIGQFLNLPVDNLYTDVKNQTVPFQLNYISKKRKKEIEQQFKFKETELIITDLRTSMELLKSRIVDFGITPTYRLLTRNTSGQQFIYNYSCTLFGLYVEGNGTSKYEAKENAAAEMLRLIIKKQRTMSLSSHIRYFNEKELNSLNPLIKLKANFVDILENTCIQFKFPPPTYTLLSHTKNYSKLEEHYSIQCDAMDFVAIGHSNKRSTAKQISAQNILKLWEKVISKSKPSK